MASKTSIANRALIKLGSTLLTNVDTDNNAKARNIRAIYEDVRNEEISKHFWKFAKDRSSLAADPTAPSFGWTVKYQLPSDWLRNYRIRDGGDPNTEVDEYDVEGSYILCDIGSIIYLEYIKIVEDVNRFHPLFREALACKIALELCEDITQSNSKKDRIKKDYNDAIAEAKRIDAIMLRPRDQLESEYITIRQ
jgi:hypothetical protein